MRYVDLKLGEEYYYSRYTNWVTSDDGRKVVLFKEGRWTKPYAWSSKFSPIPDPKGIKVWIQEIREDGEPGSDYLVSPTHLRGLWAEVKPRCQEAHAAMMAKYQEEHTARSAQLTQIRKMIDSASELGYQGISWNWHDPDHAGDRVITMTPNTFQAILEQLSRLRDLKE